MRNGVIIFVLLILIVIAGIVIGRQRRRRLTAEAPATVVRTTLRQFAPKDNGRFETDVIFRFDVAGASHEVTYTAAGNRVEAYPPGTAGRVRYNPDKPDEADVIASP